MTSKSPVGDISVVTLIRTDTTLDHSQKAEKVCYAPSRQLGPALAREEQAPARVYQHVASLARSFYHFVGSSSQANHHSRNTAMDDSIGGS